MTTPAAPSPRRARGLAIGALAAALGLVAAACGSDSKSSSGATTVAPAEAATTAAGGAATTAGGGAATTAAANDCVAKATEALKPYDERPTALPSTYTPLSKKPAAGKVIKLVNGAIPADDNSADEQSEAANGVGWGFEKIIFDGTVEDLNAKYAQAIAEKPTAITNSGWPVAAVSKSLDEAKSAGVLVALSSVTDEATGTDLAGFAATSNGSATAAKIGEINANMVLRDSGCKANVAIFNLPFPILKVATDAFTAKLTAECADCKVTDVEIQTKDLGSPAATNQMVSTLQSDPSIKYAYTIIGNVAAGLDAALSTANIKDVKIFGQVPDANAIKALQDGTNAWWVNQSSLVNGWTEMDAVLRALDSGKPYNAEDHPLGVLTPENVGTDPAPVDPTTFRDEFTKLWNP
jgi:hypothetical protein